MRVLHVYKDVYPPVIGGIERHIDAIRRALPDIEQDVLVCARGPRTRQGAAPAGRTGREILVGELGRVLSTPLAPGFPRWVSRLAPGAVVHLHMPNPLGELSVLRRRGGSPLVVSYHADIYRQRALLPLYRHLIVRCLRAAGVVVVGSAKLATDSPLIRAAGVQAEVVPYGIDVDPDGVPGERVAELRDRYGAEHALAVGVLRYYKGYDVLIEAAASMPWPVVIVGDGPERDSLESQVRRLGLEGRVHLVGAVDDERLAAHLAAASAFVLPALNRAEAFGIALLEAQAAELPVIATDVGTGVSEAFEPGVSGLLVPAGDSGAIAKAVASLASDPERRRAMGNAGRQRVLERNSLESMGRRLRPLYERLAASARQGSPAKVR